jgi:hypothetical protein
MRWIIHWSPERHVAALRSPWNVTEPRGRRTCASHARPASPPDPPYSPRGSPANVSPPWSSVCLRMVCSGQGCPWAPPTKQKPPSPRSDRSGAGVMFGRRSTTGLACAGLARRARGSRSRGLVLTGIAACAIPGTSTPDVLAHCRGRAGLQSGGLMPDAVVIGAPNDSSPPICSPPRLGVLVARPRPCQRRCVPTGFVNIYVQCVLPAVAEPSQSLTSSSTGCAGGAPLILAHPPDGTCPCSDL